MPVRETQVERRCRCVLTDPKGIKPDKRCRDTAVGPDSPFCHSCEDRHPEKDRPDLLIVTVFTGVDP
jgi:hypothetical protein